MFKNNDFDLKKWTLIVDYFNFLIKYMKEKKRNRSLIEQIQIQKRKKVDKDTQVQCERYNLNVFFSVILKTGKNVKIKY